jgi:rSAM/selenodomain-associated transferase 1
MAEIAILAKAPVAGFAKTRLIPLLGPEGAAGLQASLIERALTTALASAIGGVTLWCAPDERDPVFLAAGRRPGVRLARQPDGDLGVRMLAAFRASAGQGTVVVGTDCPALTAADLRAAAAALADADVVIAPAEDGGYGLIAASRPLPQLFDDMPWSTDQVAALTRRRVRGCGLRLVELRTVWDVDTPADVARLRAAGLLDGALSR